MKDQLIEFETAKIAKEKGFNLSVNYCYQYSLTEKIHEEDGASGPFGWKKGELSISKSYFINNENSIDTSNDNWYLCAAPTQTSLQKWLRDVHGIHIQVYVMERWLESGNSMEIYYEVNLKTTNRINGLANVKFNMLTFKTYEEALESGLQQALKLI